MTYYCSKCEYPIAEPVEFEVPDGFMYVCPICTGPVLFISHEEAEGDCPGCEPLFTSDEARYMTHIIDKQLVKLHNAADQLLNIKEKLEIFND